MMRRAWSFSSWIGTSARIACGFFLVGISASFALATEPQKEFLHALRDAGYGEMALEYIDRLEKRKDVPPDLKETLDLERGFAYRAAANEAYNSEQRNARIAESEKFIQQFIKTHPDHPASAQALVEWGGYGLEVAQRAINQSENTQNAETKKKLIEDARNALDQCLPRLEAAAKLMEKQRPALESAAHGNNPKAQEALADFDYSLLELRFKRAIASFFQAQIMDASKAKERKDQLTAVAKTFDDIYQKNRENVAGLMSHMWHGRAVQELGNSTLAFDIFEEVLANVPDSPERIASTPQSAAELFSQVVMYKLRLMSKKDPKAAIADTRQWLVNHNKWQGANSYQGVAFEVVKAQFAEAQKQTGAKKRESIREVLNLLTAMAKVPSSYQDDIVKFKQEISQTEGAESNSVTDTEVLADSALASGNVEEAEKLYEHALALATAATGADAKRLPEIKKKLNETHYRAALKLYSQGKLEEALQKAESVARENVDDAIAPAAMGAAVSTQLMLYVKSSDKPAALKKLQDMAEFMFQHWPARPEADEARFALGQANLVKGDIAEGMKLLKEINSNSKRYPQVLHYLGQASWKTYIDERKKPEASRDAAAMAKALEEARKYLAESLKLQLELAKKEAGAADAANDTSLLLADITAEAKDYPAAIALYEPLVDGVVKAAADKKPEGLDNSLLRMFMGLFKAQLAQDDIPAATAVALKLAEIAPDNAQANAFVIDNAKTIIGGVKELEVTSKEAKESNLPNAGELLKKYDDAKAALEKLLAKDTQREQLSIAAMLLLADGYSAVGKPDLAREVYEKIVRKAETEKGGPENKSLIPIRAKLVGLLREEGDFSGALKQIDKLIEANPKTLEPLMEKGRILQAMAERNPKQYAAATAHWTEVRVLLTRVTNRPPEFFEVVYNAAFCILGEARQLPDKAAREEKALMAEKLLKSTMFAEPKLSGPDMVAKYQSLLRQSAVIRGKPASSVTIPGGTK